MKETAKSDVSVQPNGGLLQNSRVRRLSIYGTVLLAVFLLGFIPMWLKGRELAKERDEAQTALRVSRLQNAVGGAALDARRGEYEPARQATSDFYTNLGAEIGRETDSGFTAEQREKMRALLAGRDDTITLLARSDPASADRLAELYAAYRQIIDSSPGGQTNP